MDVGLSNALVESVAVDFTVRLRCSMGRFVVIGSLFTAEHNGRSDELDTERDPAEAFSPIRQLVGHVIDHASADDAGTLHIDFSDGTKLRVPVDEAYEAWNVSGPDGALVVCMPGGELAIWTAQESADVDSSGQSQKIE